MTILSTITNEEINCMPAPNFAGRILVVDSAQSMNEAEELLRGVPVLGFDTETRPAFAKGVTHKMALVQISTADVAILFRVQMQPLSEAVKAILQDEKVLKIGAALQDDLRGLQRSQGRMTPRGFIDLQNIVNQWGIQEKSVKKMAAVTMGVKVSKAQRLTNWEAKVLTPSQQHYAAVDAWICREIYLHLQGEPKISK